MPYGIHVEYSYYLVNERPARRCDGATLLLVPLRPSSSPKALQQRRMRPRAIP
eukprot:COSAG01_NODE_235_length_20918_cov_41.045086_25_plen_53_part_00